MKKWFVDVTPIIEDFAGSPHALGTVRYEVTEEIFGGDIGNMNTSYTLPWTQPQPFSGSYAKIRFDVKVSSANTPQPKAIEPAQVDLT